MVYKEHRGNLMLGIKDENSFEKIKIGIDYPYHSSFIDFTGDGKDELLLFSLERRFLVVKFQNKKPKIIKEGIFPLWIFSSFSPPLIFYVELKTKKEISLQISLRSPDGRMGLNS